ncbi:MAG: ergothioneine biosynthesis protein EgtB [SAR324 cluster bacterium]|nr:ergothioneine biosynthesis protein EgtB [SAR324 cluster bacterium]
MDDKKILLNAFEQTLERTRSLLDTLTVQQRNVPYHQGINPPVWELGHSAFFYEVFILRALDHNPPLMPGFDNIWDSFDIDHEDRWIPGLIPSRETTMSYMAAVYELIRNRIDRKPLTPKDLYLYKYAIFHQNMHIESLIWCRQTLGYPKPDFSQNSAVEYRFETSAGDTEIPGGAYHIGMPAEHKDFAMEHFAFDNEKPGFIHHLEPFRISKTLVSNQQYQEFVEDKGYEREDLWSWGGKKWLQTRLNSPLQVQGADIKVSHPVYWKKQEGRWWEKHFDQWLPLEPDYPVRHVSYWEAEAWCQWAGRRLPTEFEWEAAALDNREAPAFRRYPWGNIMDETNVDMDATQLARLPVYALNTSPSPFGCIQMIGTVWEWTSSQFLPYNGFSVDMYPFMSTLQFGYHKVTRGGSCATSSSLIRGTYRQAYLPHRNDVFVGFRTCARES